jgi:hypothetical protein
MEPSKNIELKIFTKKYILHKPGGEKEEKIMLLGKFI